MDLYNFGNGDVPAHKHPNGGGWVADTAEVDITCYVGPYAFVYDNARIKDNVRIDDYARVFGNASVCQNAKVYGDAQVYGQAVLYNNSKVSVKAKVYGKAKLYDNCSVYDNAEVFDDATIRNFSEVYENSKICGNAVLIDHTKIYNDCIVTRQPLIILTGKISPIISHITITDNLISIGCIVLPPSIWKKYGVTIFKYFKNYFTYNENEMEKWINILLYMAEFHNCVDRPDDIEKIEKNKVIQRILAGETQDRNINKGTM
jgi:UDP-3-O-[3-hydroxymyristoyl] glucosamine N-acyltransferase